MLDNTSLAEKIVSAKKKEQNYAKKEHKIGILTPLATSRFEATDFSNPSLLDSRLKTLSAAGIKTNTDLMVTTTSLDEIRRREFNFTEMKTPNMKLIYTRDPDNKTYRIIQNITKNLSRLNNHSKSNWSHRDLNKVFSNLFYLLYI